MLMRLQVQKFVLSRAHRGILLRDFSVLSQMLKNVKLFGGTNYGSMFAP
jgi:hypothetical protein